MCLLIVSQLDKIQDLQLVSDCCGDACGWSEGPARPWQLHIQTAGNSGGAGAPGSAELTVVCIKDPEDFRTRVLRAKRELITSTGAEGGSAGGMAAAKTAVGAAVTGAGMSAEADATLSRMEALMREGVDLLKARRG